MLRLLLEGAASIAIMALVVIALVVTAIVRGVRAVARRARNLPTGGGARTRSLGSRCRRRVVDLRAMADPNPEVRRISALRHRLADEIDQTDRMLTDTGDGRVFTADAQALLQQLRDSAASIDADLRAVAAYRDVPLQHQALALLTEQADQLISVSYKARQTVLQTSVHDRWRSIASMTAEVDHQAGALDRYREQPSELDLDTGPTGAFGGTTV